jgi:hypothetical protein
MRKEVGGGIYVSPKGVYGSMLEQVFLSFNPKKLELLLKKHALSQSNDHLVQH